MDLYALENFLFVPHHADPGGKLFELIRSDGFDKNSFVSIPYQDPQVKSPKAEFYKVVKKTQITDLGESVEETSTKPVFLNALTSKQRYLENIKQLKLEIQKGNIYEINYCISFLSREHTIDPVSVFIKLNALSKAPYACLLKTGNDFIICASPELFLERKGKYIFTKPIKGTTRRGRIKDEDEALKEELYNNIKERTENVMAVDVARNDLSRFAGKGTVQVNKLYNIESFETVHQMVSTVSCEINKELLRGLPEDLFDRVIEASFPMASMTGAPKLRAMRLIGDYEDFERKSYSGAMGLIDGNGDFTLSVNIRSIFYNQQTQVLTFAVGGAITYLSDPEKEYEECLLKAEAMLKALNATIR